MTSRTVTGWAFVAVQAVLLGALVLLPGADHWPTPRWLGILTMVVIVAGVGIVAGAALGLGPALTATPVPTNRGRLNTSGLYGLVRHPIYTAVLTVVAAVAVRSGNLATVAIALATVGFFHFKARWEELQLAERYPSYDDYAARTPRFVPRLRRSHRA